MSSQRRPGRHKLLLTGTALLLCCSPSLFARGQGAPATHKGEAAAAKGRTQSRPAPGAPAGIDKIRHAIWISQENCSFDSYFGTYPEADGLPIGTCLPVRPGSKQCIKPFHQPT
jgi:phospholipase C